MKKLILKNSFSGILQLIISSALIFFTVSLFVRVLGAEKYGLFATLALIGNLNMLTNIGLNSTLLIYLAEKGKCIESDHNIIVSFVILSTISLVILLLILIFNKYIILVILNIPPSIYPEVYGFYILLIISNSLIFIGQVFLSILDSLQKIYLSNFYQLIYNILYNSLLIIIILISGSFFHMGIGILAASIIWFTLLFNAARTNWGPITFSGLKTSFVPLLKKQTSLGFKVYLSSLIFFLYEPMTKILMTHFLGFKDVGYFDIGLKIRNQIWGLISKATQPLLPLISKSSDKSHLKSIVHDIEQKTYIIVIPVVSAAFFCAKPIITLWIGAENSDIVSITALSITSIYLLLSSTMIPMYYYLMSKGHAEKTIYIQLTNTIVNLAFIIALYKSWGYYSFVFSYSMAIVASFLLMLYYQNKLLDSKIFDSKRLLFKLIFVFVINISIGYIINYFIDNYYIKIVSISLVMIIITILLYRTLRVVKKEDIHKYFGETSRFSMAVIKLFIKQ